VIPGATGATGPAGATGSTGTAAITIEDTSVNADFFVPFTSTFIGTINTLFVDNPGFRFNPATGNVIATNFNGRALQASYADLAERYLADSDYAPGTVLSFGGAQEVTMSTVDSDPAVAGVVSAQPGFVMNSDLQGDYVTIVALQGRVPCRVTGTVHKGSLMVSAGDGTARADINPAPGRIIGKALQAHAGAVGVIEVAVGRS
jgi:hypothetical protein